MSVFDRFLKKPPNPTQDWPIVELSQPEIDLYNVCLGTLRFGDPLSKAQCLGRPDQFLGQENAYCELHYRRCGFQVDFDAGAFAYLAFYLGPDTETAAQPGWIYAQPHIVGAGNLTDKVTEAQVRDWLGSPGDEEKDETGTVLFYPVARITMEFEFNAEGSLKRWNLYPQKE